MSIYIARNAKGEIKSSFYQYDFVVNGDRFFGATPVKHGEARSEVRAKKWEDDEKARVRVGVIKAKDAPAKDYTWDQVATLYFDDRIDGKPSEGTVTGQLAALTRHIGAETKAAKIDDETISNYVKARRKEESKHTSKAEKARGVIRFVEPETINGELKICRAALNHVADTYKQPIQRIAWKKRKLAEKDLFDRSITREEESLLLSEMAPHLLAIGKVALITGLRKENIVSLDWAQVDWERGKIKFMIKSELEGGKEHIVMLTPTLRAVLMALGQKKRGPVFTFQPRLKNDADGTPRWGEPQPCISIRSAWEGARKRAGLDKETRAKVGKLQVRFHDLRHTFGTRILEATDNIKLAKDLLGHANIKTTERYSHTKPVKRAEGMELISAHLAPEKPDGGNVTPMKRKKSAA